ncbi:hypothetical protein DIS18_14145 [Algibacter marinivivus]|uniref:Class I SAM-dependent methyltransferase n=1 Tax=Algibacter marinivivus TaxID=2100723 RepID=A0A2U2X200_9FLAO|nr:hypothetical protein [Algibacter marinivivus]PWH81813.1 hypothetical protein DIS18_14145 [Algibacter marinivivus]
MTYFLKRLSEKRIWNKIFVQRLSEPLHLNFISIFIFLFGSFRKKVAYDLVLRPQHAYSILEAADQAKERGLKTISVLEFGVANGAGLMNIIKIAKKVTKVTGINIEIFGFDTGKGMPAPLDFRDHPEYYTTGDFPMNRDLLEQNTKNNATLIYGTVKDTINDFKKTISPEAPIGFISVDVDYYSSTKEVFELLDSKPEHFLPLTYIYFDDITLPHHNDKCGELLAIKEFNNTHQYRNISYHPFFANRRIFKNADWVKQIYYFHVLDHKYRFELERNRETNVLDNPYLNFEGNKKQFN